MLTSLAAAALSYATLEAAAADHLWEMIFVSLLIDKSVRDVTTLDTIKSITALVQVGTVDFLSS